MQSAKKNIELFELDRDSRTHEKTIEHIAAIESHKARSNRIKAAPDATHRLLIEEKPETGKRISKTQLINKLNFINFQDGTVLINFSHLKYDKTITLRAAPQPCTGWASRHLSPS